MAKSKKINLQQAFIDNFGEYFTEKDEPTKLEKYYNRPFYKRYPFWLWIVFVC